MLYTIITTQTDKKEESFLLGLDELQQINKSMGIVTYQRLWQQNQSVPQGGVPALLLTKWWASAGPALTPTLAKGCRGPRQEAGHRESKIFYSPAIFSLAGPTAFHHTANVTAHSVLC